MQLFPSAFFVFFSVSFNKAVLDRLFCVIQHRFDIRTFFRCLEVTDQFVQLRFPLLLLLVRLLNSMHLRLQMLMRLLNSMHLQLLRG
jgi:hypothetical protein